MDNLDSLYEQLVNGLSAELEYVRTLDARQITLDEEGRQIKIKQDELVAGQAKLKAQQDEIAREKEFIAIALKKTQEQEINEKRIEAKQIELNKQKDDLALEEDKIAQQRKALEIQIAELATLKKTQEEFKIKENLLIKQEQILDQRKENLDTKEKFLDSEIIRVRKLADQWNR